MARKQNDLGALQEGCGLRLRALRTLTGLAQGEFAKRAGIRQSAYSQYENGKRLPDLVAAVKLCKTYELTLDWLLLGTARPLNYDFILRLKEIGVKTDMD